MGTGCVACMRGEVIFVSVRVISLLYILVQHIESYVEQHQLKGDSNVSFRVLLRVVR